MSKSRASTSRSKSRHSTSKSVSLPPSPNLVAAFSKQAAPSLYTSFSSSTIHHFHEAPADDNKFLLKWLRDNHLEHLYDKLSKSHISITALSQCDEKTIHNTSKFELNLSGRDLSIFERSLVKYHNIQCLKRRNKEVSSCIDSLEFTKNELNIKKKGDILYVTEKFKKLMKTLKNRENTLIEQIKKSAETKKNILSEQISSMKDYKHKLDSQHKILSKKKLKKKDTIEQNKKTKRLLHKTVKYNKKKFAKINKMSVEIAEFDDLMSKIKKTGVIIDEFDEKRTRIQVTLDDGMNCLCGIELIFTNAEYAYKHDDDVFCNFCTKKCVPPYNGDIYHCPEGDVILHPGGFDLCKFCATQCLEVRKADQKRKREEEQRRKMERMFNRKPIHRQSRSLSAMGSGAWEHSRNGDEFGIIGFLYDKQLKQLRDMGYDHKLCAKLLVKYKGNMIEVMPELLT